MLVEVVFHELDFESRHRSVSQVVQQESVARKLSQFEILPFSVE